MRWMWKPVGSREESSVWDIRWGLFPGSAGAESRVGQGTCVDGCRAGRRPERLCPLNRITTYGPIPYLYLPPASNYWQAITLPLDALEAMDPLAGLKRARHIAAHASFFWYGICVRRTFVCVVKMSPLSSTIKIFEPINQNIRGRNKPTVRSANSCRAATIRSGYTRNSATPCSRARYTFCARSSA